MAPYKAQYDGYAHHGRSITLERHDKLKQKINYPHLPPLLAALSNGQLPKSKYPKADPQSSPVGILGAGIGGLYTALMLQSLNLPYKIIEARDRTGGRLYTYKFPGGGTYDYFDVGAMRFPLPPNADEPSVMTRLYHLIHYPPLNPPVGPGLSSKVIPYYFTPKPGGGDAFLFYNEIRSDSASVTAETFKPEAVNVPEPYASVLADDIMTDVLGPFSQLLVDDLKNGTDTNWKKFRSDYDKYSAQAYMAIRYSPSPKLLQLPLSSLPANVINWCETLTESTASFGRAFTEAILDNVMFNNEGLLKSKWSCFDGGSQTLSNAVEAYLNQVNPNSIVLNQPIMSITGDPNPGTPTPITIITGGPNGTTYQFDNVISTLPLPILRVLNVTPGLLSPLQAMALHQLQYVSAVKIGIRFKSPWWTTGMDKDGKPFNIIGGYSSTDRPIRTVVYPSYGVNTPSNVLIASHCWANDADHLQALCDAYLCDCSDSVARRQLTDMVLNDLEDVHNLNCGTLVNEVASTPYDSGASAFFGPGQFEDLYDSLNAPSPNRKLLVKP